MEHWELAFTGNWPTVLVAAVGAAAALLAWAFYRRKRPGLGRVTFAMLSGLRTAAILILALFLLEPVLRLARAEAARASAAVLVDVSESMGIRDTAGDRSRLESGLMLLRRDPTELLRRLAETHDLRIFAFGALATELDDAEEIVGLSPQQKATALGDALLEAVRQTRGSRLAGIVLLSDGISTRGEDPEQVARTLGVPVFPVALGGRVGERGRFHDVGVAGVPQNPQLIVNNRAELPIELSHAGLGKFTAAERTLTVRLMEGDVELAQESVALPSADGAAEVVPAFVPRRTGMRRLRVEVANLPDETVVENNSRSFTVTVTDPRIRVLIVEGVVRSEYRFLRRVLESDPNLEVSSVIKLSGRRFLVQGVQPGVDLSRGLPARREDYENFDVVVLGDIGRDEFTGVQLEYLKEFIDGGGALTALGGYHALGAGGYADTPVADVLPVTLGGELDGHAEESFVPVLTGEGRRHAVFAGCEEFFGAGRAQGALDGCNRVAGAKPGAQVLAVHPTERAGGAPMPVAAVQRYGSGRTMCFTADTTWKWKFQVEAQGRDSPYYRFWRQSIRYLAGRREEEPEPDRLVSAWAARPQYGPGEPVMLKARVLDRQGEPEDAAAVEVAIGYPIPVRTEGPEGEPATESSATVALRPVPLSLGEYQAAWRPPASGLYQATARAADEQGELGSDTFEFVVGQAATEFDRVDVDEATLRALAAHSGGTYSTLVTAGNIPDELEQRRSVVVSREELSLWNAPWFFAVFLGCVTAEWILRKRKGLN